MLNKFILIMLLSLSGCDFSGKVVKFEVGDVVIITTGFYKNMPGIIDEDLGRYELFNVCGDGYRVQRISIIDLEIELLDDYVELNSCDLSKYGFTFKEPKND